jgi:hypothetical protein
MLRRLSTYTVRISPRSWAGAGKGAKAQEELGILVTFFDGTLWAQLRFSSADFDSYMDRMAAR